MNNNRRKNKPIGEARPDRPLALAGTAPGDDAAPNGRQNTTAEYARQYWQLVRAAEALGLAPAQAAGIRRQCEAAWAQWYGQKGGGE